MTPNGVWRGQPDVYVNDSPGASTGCLPTTPGPRTSSTWPVPSVMIQCRVTSCAVSVPSFVIVIVYRKNHSFFDGCDRSGAYSDSTRTLMPPVTASDVNIRLHDKPRAARDR